MLPLFFGKSFTYREKTLRKSTIGIEADGISNLGHHVLDFYPQSF